MFIKLWLFSTAKAGRKHCGKKEKILITNIFYFTPNGFHIDFFLRIVKIRDRLIKRFNSSPNDKLVHWSKLKAFADDKINVPEKLKFLLERIENIVGKGENAGDQHFLLLPQCFQKVS